VKEFGESSTKLEFDEFDDVMTDGGQHEGENEAQSSPEEVNEGGEGGESVEDGESESKPRKEAKPPTVDEYQWRWKVSDPGSRLVVSC
jgi:hypothetical protein